MDPDVVSLPHYAPRHVRFVGLQEAAGYTLKCYTITTDGSLPAPHVLDAAISASADYLGTRPSLPPIAGVDWWALPSYGLGSLIVHVGNDAVFAIMDVWVDASMLRHRVWAAPLSNPQEFVPLTPSDLTMCVWELVVIQYERAAWLTHMFRADGRSDRTAYLADVINTIV